MKTMPWMILAALLFAPVLCAQQPGPGDLIPRSGTLAYMVSDRPEALYQLMGRDAAGGWKLRSYAYENALEHVPEGSDEREQQTAVLDFVFNTYESLARVEIGLLDVTVDGPKYAMVLHAKPGRSIEVEPEFLADFVAARSEFHGVTYVQYRVPTQDDEFGGGPDLFGMDRYYVAATPGGAVIANFESSMRDLLERLATGDYSESLSARAEFKEWIEGRTPHDLSIFVIARELQNAIERVLPGEFTETYRGVDSWLQLREYRSIVIDIDYEEAARGFTIAGTFKTRRPTRLLQRMSVAPAEFKLLRHVPAGAAMIAGSQLGEARTTFENMKELARDVEGWIEGLGIFGPPMMPPDTFPPEAPGDWDEQGSFDIARVLRGLSQMAEDDEEPQTEIDRMLAQLESSLSEYGTSLDEILSVVGTELLFFMEPDLERAKGSYWGTPDMSDAFSSAGMGLILGLKDAEKAQAILARAMEADPDGAFSEIQRHEGDAGVFLIHESDGFGWTFTSDAFLFWMTKGDVGEEGGVARRGLLSMLRGSSTTGNRFIATGSRFFHMDFGPVAEVSRQLSTYHSERLDRYAQPAHDDMAGEMLSGMTLSLRTLEQPDGIQFAMRLSGLPDFWKLIDGGMMGFGAGMRAYLYGEQNLRTLSEALRERANQDKPLDLAAMLEAGEIRVGVLQIPTDSRWQGDPEDLGWISLDMATRDSEGNAPPWVDEKALAMIEANEKASFHSVRLVEGEIAQWLKEAKSGFIVAMQEKPDTKGGHLLLYADGQTGWLHAKVIEEALKLNAEGKPVPAAGFGGVVFPGWDDEDMMPDEE